MSVLSNSALMAFQKCPTYYRERYVNGLDSPLAEYLAFGTRFHQMLEAHYISLTGAGVGTIPPAPYLDPQLELEAQAMFAAYKAFYPREPFEVLDTEKRFEIKKGELTYIGRFDMLVRNKETRRLQLFETKTEKRGSKRNHPEAWAARSQVSLYTWAATQVYGERVDSIILNVCTRGSEKGRIGPTFRRDTLQRTDAQVEQAVLDLTWVNYQVLDLGEATGFPRNTNNCVSEFGQKCTYYSLCHYGDSPESRAQFVKLENPFGYLEL